MTQEQITFQDAEFEENTMAQEEARVEQEILREFEADGSSAQWLVKIKKVNERTKKQDDCFEITPDEMKAVHERLEEEYGAGEYRLYVKRDGVLKHNLRLGIAKRKTPPPSRDDSGMAGLVAQMANMMERQTEQIANIARGAAPAATPPQDQATMMNGMLDTLIKMKEFTGGGAGEKAGKFEDFMSLWEMAKEVASERGGGAGNSTAADIFREFIKSPMASELAESMREQRQLAAAHRGALPAPPPAAQPPASQPMTAPGAGAPAQESPPSSLARPDIPGIMQPGAGAPAQESPPSPSAIAGAVASVDPVGALDPQMQARLKSDVDGWIARAKANSDPGLYAEVTLDTYPVEIIRAVLLRDDLKALVIALNPEAEYHWPWFADLIDEVKHLLTQAESQVQGSPHVSEPQERAAPAVVNGDSERPGGGVGDAGNHESVDPAGADRPDNPGESD